MGAKIPEAVSYELLISVLEDAGLEHLYTGKVRETFRLPGGHLFMLATDRISSFDVVVAQDIPGKGAALNAMTVKWLTGPLRTYPHHLIAYGFLQRNGMVVWQAQPLLIECIVRGYITGSGWNDYQKSGAVCGISLPPGLNEGDRLPEPIYTPSTKAADGEHDENISYERTVKMLGADLAANVRELALEIYKDGAAEAERNGIIIADTKLEFGLLDGSLILVDEVLTPDSSRFWPRRAWQNPDRKGSPPSLDKQVARDWLKAHGFPADESVMLPPEVVEQVQSGYLRMVEVVCGKPLEEFQRDEMGITA